MICSQGTEIKGDENWQDIEHRGEEIRNSYNFWSGNLKG